MEEIAKEMIKCQNIETDIELNMFLEDKDIKIVDEKGFEDMKEIDLKRKEEFGFSSSGNKVEISFSFGTIKIKKSDFDEALKRYFKLTSLINMLNKNHSSKKRL